MELEYLMDIAKFSMSFNGLDVRSEVRARAKLLILDSLTAIAYGNQHSEVSKLSDKLVPSEDDRNRSNGLIFGTNIRTDIRTAAFVNGIAMVSDELDEGNPLAKGHPSCHFLSSFLSLALQRGATGEDFLSAFIISYEINARMGASIQQNAVIHPHGNWGMFGNSFGTGRFCGWKREEDYIQAAMLSMSFSMPTLWQSVLEGHKVRNVIIGLNNLHTVMLPDLIESGFSASLTTPEIMYSDLLGKSIKTDLLTKDLGKEFYLMRSYFKFYSYCRFCHSPIDAVMSLTEKINIEEIEKILISTYSSAAKLHQRQVNNEFAGKFSIPYAVASELCKTKLSSFEKEESQKNITQLMQKIFVSEEQSYTEMLPEKRLTSVSIELKNGSVIGTTVQRAKGDPDEENLTAKVIGKSRELLTLIFGEQKAESFIEAILTLEDQEDLSFVYESVQ